MDITQEARSLELPSWVEKRQFTHNSNSNSDLQRFGMNCPQVPAPINQYLRDYQRDGIAFLYRHYKNKTGCILGDDMGLGKTIQVTALGLICKSLPFHELQLVTTLF